MTEPSPLLRIQEARAMLNVNEKTLRLMIKRGTLTAVKLGPKTTRVTLQSVQAFTVHPLFGPSYDFDTAREAIYVQLNAAIRDNDMGAVRKANEANRLLSYAKSDHYAGGGVDNSRGHIERAIGFLPCCCDELNAYGGGLC